MASASELVADRNFPDCCAQTRWRIVGLEMLHSPGGKDDLGMRCGYSVFKLQTQNAWLALEITCYRRAAPVVTGRGYITHWQWRSHAATASVNNPPMSNLSGKYFQVSVPIPHVYLIQVNRPPVNAMNERYGTTTARRRWKSTRLNSSHPSISRMPSSA